MEQWRDQGIVLAARAHGESGAVVTLLTENHGRHIGYLRGGQSSRLRPMLEAGTLVAANWMSRLNDNMGTYVMESERNLAAGLLHDSLRLGALLSACALCDAALPEREAHPGLFFGLQAVIAAMEGDAWGAAYVIWELALLRELGFGMELSRCAANGDAATLEYVSPRSGHAVSAAAGEIYKEKLLPLPAFLKPQRGEATDEEIVKGLKLTGYFLEHWAFAQHTRGIPEERLRFVDRFAKTNAGNTDLQRETA